MAEKEWLYHSNLYGNLGYPENFPRRSERRAFNSVMNDLETEMKKRAVDPKARKKPYKLGGTVIEFNFDERLPRIAKDSLTAIEKEVENRKVITQKNVLGSWLTKIMIAKAADVSEHWPEFETIYREVREAHDQKYGAAVLQEGKIEVRGAKLETAYKKSGSLDVFALSPKSAEVFGRIVRAEVSKNDPSGEKLKSFARQQVLRNNRSDVGRAP